jgi:beta-phosphoglucomutase-like phosphatase (HAD superfamily)
LAEAHAPGRKDVARGGAAISAVPLSANREEPTARASALALPEAIGLETQHEGSGHEDSRRRVASPTWAEPLVAGWLSEFVAVEKAFLDDAAGLSPADTRKHLQRLHAEREEIAVLLEELAHGQRGAALLVRCLGQPTIDLRLLRLPSGVSACIFDVEGALTTSAAAHCEAWRVTLDSFLFTYTERLGRRYVPFDPHHDYLEYLDGRPRLAGLRAFLASRGASLPEGEPSDRPGAESVHGLANQKQEALRRYVERNGIEAFAGSRAYLEVAGIVGARRAVVSASTNTSLVLERAGVADLIEEQIDGNVLERDSLSPLPAPDMILAACARLGVAPAQGAVFAAAPAAITAARAAGVHTAIGVARDGNSARFSETGADLVVTDLGEMLEPDCSRRS